MMVMFVEIFLCVSMLFIPFLALKNVIDDKKRDKN